MIQLSKPIKFAVIGLGRIGYRHAEQITKTEGFGLAAVCDSQNELCDKAAKDFPDVAILSDFDELLAKGQFEVLVIAVPSHLHYEMTMKALESGKNVIVEKPMAANAQEGKVMLAKAREVQKFLTISQTLRYQYDTVKVKEIIESGQIGRVFQVYLGAHDFNERKDWQIWKKYYGGSVANLGAHFVDAAMLMVKSKPETVFAKLNRILDQGDAEDCFKIIVRHAGGEIVETELVRAYYGKACWHVCGTKGSIYIDDVSPVIKVQLKTLDGEIRIEKYDYRNGVGNIPPYYNDLAEKLLTGQEPPVTAKSIIAQLAIIDAVRKSDETGEFVNIIQ